MKKFIAVVENPEGIVVGAQTDKGQILVAPEEQVPRAQLAAVAVTLANKYGVDPASFTLPEPTPAPAGNDSTPQGAD